MKSSATKKAVKAATESAGGMKRFKWDDNRITAELLILGTVSDDVGAVFTSKNHEDWVKGRPASRSGTPSYTSKEGGRATGEQDKIVNTGWKLRDRFANSKNEKKKDLYRKFLLNTQHHVNVLDLKNIEAGPMVYTMPSAVANVVLEEFKDVGEDTTSICDFDEGRKLYIKSNGEKGLKRRYTLVKFKSPANLLEDGTLTSEDVEDIAGKIFDLRKLQLSFNEESFEKHYNYLLEKASALGVEVDGYESDEDEELEDEYVDADVDDEDEEEDLGVDEEELNLEDDEDEYEDDEDDEEPMPVRTKKKKQP